MLEAAQRHLVGLGDQHPAALVGGGNIAIFRQGRYDLFDRRGRQAKRLRLFDLLARVVVQPLDRRVGPLEVVQRIVIEFTVVVSRFDGLGKRVVKPLEPARTLCEIPRKDRTRRQRRSRTEMQPHSVFGRALFERPSII